MTAYAQMERSFAPPLERNTPVCHVVHRLLFRSLRHGQTLLHQTLLPPLAGSLGLQALGVHLLLGVPHACLLGLGLVDMLDESTLVLEGVTLAEMIELVVQVLVDLAGGTVLDEETAEDTETTHPQDLAGHTSILGTLPLTKSTVATNPSGGSQGTSTGTRVHCDGFADDETIGHEFADGLAGVGVGNFIDFVGIQPDLALSASNNGRRKALLRAEIDHFGWVVVGDRKSVV